jgi:hypothetical protein
MRSGLLRGLAGLTLLACAGFQVDAADVGPLVARIKAVGREGAGNAEAAKAWKELVAVGPEGLLDLLASFEGVDPVAANYLRNAADAIGEKAITEGKPLPKARLEAFVVDRKNNPVGRRIAYEWLVRLDPQTPSRLLPGMLQDPSPELRRDAVARVIEEADALLAKEDKPGAIAAYQKAFSGVCDEDQVLIIVAALDKLGVKVDIAEHFGVVRTWQLIAGFDNTSEVGFKAVYPPEKGVDLAAVLKGKGGVEARWVEHTTGEPYGIVDLNKVLGKQKAAVAYAYAVVDSPAERAVEVRVGSINAVKVFLNGKEIYAHEEYHHGSRFDQYTARGTLKKGRNELLLKICQNDQKDEWAQVWNLQARLCDSVGAAVPFRIVPREVKP